MPSHVRAWHEQWGASETCATRAYNAYGYSLLLTDRNMEVGIGLGLTKTLVAISCENLESG